jgi:penicillin G amidase
MFRLPALFLLFCTLSGLPPARAQRPQKPVEVIRDNWGVAHIYAQNEHDLFWAQGYVAAQDRLFQLEIWRRQATGTVAELLGPAEIKRDIGTRLFQYRGNLDKELASYHPHGRQIIGAFVEGINAWVAEVRDAPEKLPVEFRLLNTKPGFWTPAVVISRHQGLLSNLRDELNYGRLVHLIGPDKLRELQWFHPRSNPDTEPDLTLRVNGEQLMQPILELYEAFRLPIRFSGGAAAGRLGPGATDEDEARHRARTNDDWFEAEKQYVGSNNWVVSGPKTASGYPILANDPHRAQSVPSLRYMVHLNAPGWNVAGAGEPTLPGVSIGHNDFGAWGLTIFDTDNEDLYVYETRPGHPDQYKYKGKWEAMTSLTETIPVKGGPAVTATLRFTRHGPVVFDDARNHRAYAVRSGAREQGCSPYLASLRMNQARNWTQFRAACLASRIPGENMVWADRQGTIGWQAVGLAPIRPNFTGLVPVPGDGRYEWAGYLPIRQLPNSLNPAAGFIATANNNLTPANFPHRNAIGWVWANPSRAHRIEEVLGNGQRHTLTDMMALQTDYLSIPARTLVPLLTDLSSPDTDTERALAYLRKWDYTLAPNSVAAGVYAAWESQLRQAVHRQLVPERARPYLKSLPLKRVMDQLLHPTDSRDSLLLTCLSQAVTDLKTRLGNDPDDWVYGQRANKHIELTHPLSLLADAAVRPQLNLGPIPRGGNGETVNATGNELTQQHGASFRILIDIENWDNTLSINTPGQSGNPASPHYRDLYQLWGRNGYFPFYFSRKKVESVAETTTVLKP